jgi:hypothetical protein
VSASTRRGGCRRARTWKAAPDLAATTERARGEPPRGRGRRESCRGGGVGEPPSWGIGGGGEHAGVRWRQTERGVKGRRRRRRDAGRRREKKGRERVDAQAVRGAAGLRCNFQRAEGLFAKLTGGGAGASAARHVDREMRGAKETAVAFHFSDLPIVRAL